MWRAAFEPMWMSGAQLRYPDRDDRRHRAPAVADPLEQIERLLEEPGRLVDERRDRKLGQDRLQDLPRRHPLRELDVLAGHHPFDEPRSNPTGQDHTDLTERRGQLRVISQLPGELRRPPVRLFGAVEVDLSIRVDVPLSDRGLEEVLAELHARGELGLPVAARHGEPTHLAGQVCGAILLLGRTERGGPAQTHVELEIHVAERLGEGGELGQALDPVARPAKHVQGPVTRLEQRHPILGRGGRRQCDLDNPQHLLGRVGRKRAPTGFEREPDADLGVASGLRVVREERQALRRGLPGQEHRDDRGVQRSMASRRKSRRRELTHLFVREAEIGGRALVVRDQQAGANRGLEQRREVLGARWLVVAGAALQLVQVLQAEAPAEDGGLGQGGLRRIREVSGAARDHRAHRGGHHPLGVARERPHPVDLLDQAAVSIRLRHLADDERHALCLGVHRRGARRMHRRAEQLFEQLARFELREAVHLQPTHETHPIHVGQQVDGFGDQGELLRSDREHQKDRARRSGPDEIAEQAQAVVVGPLEVIDEQRERALCRELPHREGGEVVRAQEPLIGREGREARVVVPGHRLEAPAECVGGRCPLGDRHRVRRTDDRAREQERAAELLVGRHRDRRDAAPAGDLDRGQEQPRLPDARFALDGQPGETVPFHRA